MDDRKPEPDALDETAPAESAWTEPAVESGAPATRLADGTHVDRYVITGHLGSGGMGTVYRAYDPRLDRGVALKLLRATGKRHRTATDRLLREAQALAKLAHPNIVSVFDAGPFEDQVYVTMELVDGTTLRDWLADGERATGEILEAFREAAKGLAAAHRADVVHRDFKPANVMVGSDGRVRVLDFGLARVGQELPEVVARDAADEGPVDLTRTGAILGTPAYMAPEQHRAEPVGPAADQFAFCVALWEALYGSHPFGGSSAAEYASRASSGAVQEPANPSEVPSAVQAALRRGLSAEPEDRYPSMDELLAAIAPASRTSRATALWLVAAAAAIAVAIAAMVMLRGQRAATTADVDCEGVDAMLDDAWSKDRRAAVATRIADADIRAMVLSRVDVYADQWRTKRRAVCRQRDESYGERVQCLDSARIGLATVTELLAGASPRTQARSHHVLAQLPELAQCDLSSGEHRWRVPAATPEATRERKQVTEDMQRAMTLRTAGKLEEARRIVAGHVAKLDGISDVYARSVAARIGAVFARDPAAAETLLRRAIRWGISVRDEVGVVKAYADLIGSLVQQKRYDDVRGEALNASAHSARMKLFVKTWPRMGKWAELLEGRIANLQGIAEQAQGRHREAIPHFRRALAAWKHVEKDHPDRVAYALVNMAETMRETGDVKAAIDAQSRALALFAPIEATNRHAIAVTRQNRAVAYMRTAAFDEAAKDLEVAGTFAGNGPRATYVAFGTAELALMRRDAKTARASIPVARTGWSKDPRAKAEVHLCDLLACRLAWVEGRVKEARKTCATAADGLRAAAGDKHPVLAMALAELGFVESLSGDHKRAAAHASEALAIYQATTGPGSFEAAFASAALGRALVRRGAKHRDAAERALRAAIRAYTDGGAGNHPWIAMPLLDLADLLSGVGKDAEATALRGRAQAIVNRDPTLHSADVVKRAGGS